MPASPVANPTRQQLDELDDLLQKMLQLPVSQIDDAMKAKPAVKPAPPPAAAKLPPPPAPTKSVKPEIAFGVPPAPSYVSEPAKPAAKPATNWTIDLNPKQGSSVLGNRSPLAEPAPVEEKVAAAPTIVPPLAPHLKLEPIAEKVDAPPTPVVMLVLVGVNRAFDGFTRALGPTGSLFSGPLRNAMGFVGLIMLAGSLAWSAGWLR